MYICICVIHICIYYCFLELHLLEYGYNMYIYYFLNLWSYLILVESIKYLNVSISLE